MSTRYTRDRLPATTTSRFARRAASADAAGGHHDPRLDRLIEYLPERWRNSARWLRGPAARWVRVPFAILFLVGGFLAFLPVLGLWMIPVGLILLAEDLPPLRRLRARILDWAERRWPHVFAHPDQQKSDKEETTVRSFEEREKGFEAEFKRNQELQFRVTARRNKLFGLWAAAKLGISEDEAETYARAVVDADFERPGDGDVIEKVQKDLAAKSIELTEAQLRTELTRLTDEAKRQIMQQ